MEINVKFSFKRFLNKWAYLAKQGKLRSRQTITTVRGRGVDPRQQGGLQRWVSGTARSDKVHTALQEFLWPITLPSLMAGPPFSALTSKSERIISSAKTHGPHF